MNTWNSFLRAFYGSDRVKYGKCANTGTLKRASRVYHCQKKKDSKTKRVTDKFRGTNPMHKRRGSSKKDNTK